MRKSINEVQIGLYFQFGAMASTALESSDRDWSAEFSTFDRAYEAIQTAYRKLPSHTAEIADGPDVMSVDQFDLCDGDNTVDEIDGKLAMSFWFTSPKHFPAYAIAEIRNLCDEQVAAALAPGDTHTLVKLEARIETIVNETVDMTKLFDPDTRYVESAAREPAPRG